MPNGGGGRDRRRENEPATEKSDLELDDLYSVEYLADVAGGNARAERLEELKRRIELGAYKPDPDAIAEGMLSRVGIGSEDD
jgi:anti-sigma28 factor (negative regulator of flagellin synthesis)